MKPLFAGVMNSLRAKLTLASVGLLLTFIWAVAFSISTFIQPRMEALQMDRQYEITQYLAADLDQDIRNRLQALSKLVAGLDANRVTDTRYLRKYLDAQAVPIAQFDGGVLVIGLNGRVRAEMPELAGRKDLDYSERDNFKQAIATRQPYIGKPTIGLSLQRPVFVMSIPVIDATGKVRAVVSGISDLTSQGLLGPMLAARALGRSEIFVFSIRDNLVIAAPDLKRVLTPSPLPGQSAIYDRFLHGFEGSAVATNSSNVMKLFSGKRLHTVDWLLVVTLPSDIAFADIRALLVTVYSLATLATVLTLVLVRWMTRRFLAPLTTAGVRLDAMSSGQEPLQELPETGEEEVRQLLASFNRLSRQLHQKQTALQRSESTYRSLFDNMINGFAYCQMVYEDGVPIDFVYLNVNCAFETQTGLRDVVGKKVTEVIPGVRERDPEMLRTYGRVASSGVPEHLEYFVESLQQWFLLSLYSTQPGHFVAVFEVITEQKRAEQELRLAATAFEAHVGIIVTDAHSVILRVNRALTEDTGYTAEEVVGRTPQLFKSGRHDRAFYAAMWESIRRNGVWQGEIWDRRKNGEIYPKWQTITAVKAADGAVSHYVSTQTDITERKAAEAEIKYLAFFDQLTGLANRRLLLDRLHQALAGSARSERLGALVLIDLDHFKTLNDSLGHNQGDLLLQQVAQRLNGCVREGDTVARLGGDEFVVLLVDLGPSTQDAASLAEIVGEKIRTQLSGIYQLDQQEYRNSASIGITLLGPQPASADELLKQADMAMYQAKTAGRNGLRFFDPGMQAAVTQRLALERDLEHAVCAGQLRLHFQPLVDGEGGVGAAEVLVRWQHPQRGLVYPDHFIPLAEETGLILPLGMWVLEAACVQLAKWSAHARTADLALAVNVSVQQLRQPDFVEQVLAALARTGANPERLKLEITESQLMEDVEATIAKMNALKARGVGFALDDFGTGYSSLAYLKRLPLEKLKIDRSFVMDVLTDPNDAAIAKTIVALAKGLGLAVVAEGVETEQQREFLTENGCHVFQGYLFSKPLPLDAFEQYFHQSSRRNILPAAEDICA